jgi:hypothetical protein
MSPIALLLVPAVAAAVDFRCSDTACLIATLTIANATPASDTIALDAGRTYQLESTHNDVLQETGLPTITTPVVLRGNGAILQRNPLRECDPVHDNHGSFGLLAVAQGGRLTVENLTLRFGCGWRGGAIHNRGSLELYGVTVLANVAIGGGGVFSLDGMLIARSSQFRLNRLLSDSGQGGGVSVSGGEAHLNLCDVIQNEAPQGAGIEVTNGTLSFNGVIRSNRAVQGGGIHARGAQVTLDGARLIGNFGATHGGGMTVSRTRLEISNTRVQDNITNGDGAGLHIHATPAGGLWSTIRSSSIVRNRAAADGGGLSLSGNTGGLSGLLVIVNTTIGDNEAMGAGAGLHAENGANAFVFHSTFAGNHSKSGSAVASTIAAFPTTSPSARIELSGSILGKGRDPAQPVCFAAAGAAPPLSSGHNIGEDGTCNLVGPRDHASTAAGLLRSVDTGQPNGWRFPLGLSSIARDGGNFAACGGMAELRFDQLGGLRSDLMCDIGSIEFSPPRLEARKGSSAWIREES